MRKGTKVKVRVIVSCSSSYKVGHRHCEKAKRQTDSRQANRKTANNAHKCALACRQRPAETQDTDGDITRELEHARERDSRKERERERETTRCKEKGRDRQPS